MVMLNYICKIFYFTGIYVEHVFIRAVLVSIVIIPFDSNAFLNQLKLSNQEASLIIIK